MTQPLRYDFATAAGLLDGPASDVKPLAAITPQLNAARQEVLDDVALLTEPSNIPDAKQPLDAGFYLLPEQLLAGSEDNLLDRMQESADKLRQKVDKLVVLGIGGSYMGLRALFEALKGPYHNERSRQSRGDVPRLYYDGNNLDNDCTAALLELLSGADRSAKNDVDRWGIVVISKSGGTLETAGAFRIYRDALEQFYGTDSAACQELVVPITGESGKLRNVANDAGYPDIFPIPDGVGGRFSVFTAVGLYPAAVLGIDIRELLQGAASMNERFRTAPVGENPVLDYVGISHLFERDHGMSMRVLSTWGNRLEAVGLWYDQLLAESLGKEERGATPLTVVNTRDLHSRGQQHQEGKRDRIITNLYAEEASTPDVKVPTDSDSRNHDNLNALQRRYLQGMLEAARLGTDQAYADVRRPTADIVLPKLTPFALGELLQLFMLATVVEGRLIGINPYGQPGVEDYKRNMSRILFG